MGDALYPARWEADVVLADGATVHLRPIRPDDAERIADFHGRQSPQSIYYRFFSPRPRLSPAEIERFTTVDYEDRMAFVAILDDELVGVARYDRWRGRAEAEVAVFIDDEHNGRGMATVLLEYLAAAAREAGLAAFTASVLPDNRKMLGVLKQAGFTTASRFAEGVIEVRLDLQPTPEAEAAIEARARRAASSSVRRLLSPAAVAVIGASRTPGTAGHEIFRHLVHRGFVGPVYPVNSAAVSIGGVRFTASILDIVDEIDLAVVAVPADQVASVMEECGRKQVYGVIVISAGFAEIGPEGAAREAEVLAIARRYGIRLLGPNCLGVINTDPAVSLHATFATPSPTPGRVAVLSESGTLGAVIVERAKAFGVGLSSFVAMGNRADVSGNDLLQYWEEDERTDVVVAYIESFGNPRRFGRIVRHLARSKPIVALKGGRTTGEGLPDATGDAVLAQSGVIRVDTLSQLVDVARVLVRQPLPAGNRVALIGNSGGALALAADACRGAGLVPAGEPLDLGLEAQPADYGDALSATLEDAGVDAALVLFAPSLGERSVEVARAIGEAATRSATKAVVASFFGPHELEVAGGGELAVPVFDLPDVAAYALGRVAAYGIWRSEPEGRWDTPDIDDATARDVVEAALERGGPGWLELEDVTRVLDAVGSAPITTLLADSEDEAAAAAAKLGFPVALKASGRSRMAKTEASGLALDLHDEDEVRVAYGRMCERLGDAMAPAIVQRMVEPGVDIALAVRAHPFVGPVVLLGPGGAAGALDERNEVRVLPVTDLEARRMIECSRLGPLLDEQSRVTLEDLVLRLSALVEAVPDVVEIELDPVILSGGAAHITDARLRVERVPIDDTPPVRRLD